MKGGSQVRTLLTVSFAGQNERLADLHVQDLGWLRTEVWGRKDVQVDPRTIFHRLTRQEEHLKKREGDYGLIRGVALCVVFISGGCHVVVSGEQSDSGSGWNYFLFISRNTDTLSY